MLYRFRILIPFIFCIMRYCILSGIIISILLSCKTEIPSYTRLYGKAQGTTFNINYLDPEERDFTPAVDSLLRIIDKSMSLWDSTSIISGMNRNEEVQADEHFLNVFNKAHEVSLSTGGAFDITVSPLVKAWGFSFKKGMPPPDSSQVDSLKSLVGFEKVRLANGYLQKKDSRIEIDMNAIAQGYTVDLISVFLESKGISNYLVEIGGEVRAQGLNHRDTTWVIGIDQPVENSGNERPLQTSIRLENKSMATSGSYRKFIERDGKKYSHVIDPKTGYPVNHTLLSVSVIAGDCISADSYATAFMVMGLKDAMKKADELGLEIYCIYSDADGRLKTESTSGFGR